MSTKRKDAEGRVQGSRSQRTGRGIVAAVQHRATDERLPSAQPSRGYVAVEKAELNSWVELLTQDISSVD